MLPRRCSPSDSYWRDLIAFTWNIVTVEGPDGSGTCCSANLERVQPSGFAVADDLGEPTEAGGCHRVLDQLRDRCRTLRRPAPAQGRPRPGPC